MNDSSDMLDQMANEIFDLYLVIAQARSRRPAGDDEISEAEFVTLNILAKGAPLTIGEIQRRVGVLPAQMSRIIRSLEEHGGRGYVACSINPDDRRRVDVSLTPSGRKAYESFRATRLGSMYEVLKVLSPKDRQEFMRTLHKIHEAFRTKLAPEAS